MRSNMKLLGVVATLLLGAVLDTARVQGADAYPLFTDPNAGGLAFGATDIFMFGGAYSVNDAAQLNGNDIVSISQFGTGGGTGAGISVPVSNGENGIDQSLDGVSNEVVNPDAPNMTAANSVFAAISNASGKLENGNVIRYSAWFRSDPANPITVDPQIQPVLKLEFWKEALSTNQDTGGGQLQPFFGDKVFDQDQHGGALGIPVGDKAQWIDFNGDGVVIDGAAAGEGRVSSISTSAWTLVESMYTVNDDPGTSWLGIADDYYPVEDIEEIRAVMFLGDFAGTDLSGDGDGGNLLIDNVLVEVFKDAASVTANTNPNPTLSEGLPGDANGDGSVDAADYVVLRDAGMPLDTWRANFGRMLGSGSVVVSTTAVPEPAAAALVLLAVVVTAFARRRPT